MLHERHGMRYLECEAIDYVAHSTQIIVLVPRSSVDVDADAREGSWEGLGGHADPIGKGCHLVQFSRIL